MTPNQKNNGIVFRRLIIARIRTGGFTSRRGGVEGAAFSRYPEFLTEINDSAAELKGSCKLFWVSEIRDGSQIFPSSSEWHVSGWSGAIVVASVFNKSPPMSMMRCMKTLSIPHF